MGKPTWTERVVSALRVRRFLVRAALAELLGTFLLVTIGNGSVAQVVLSREAKGTFLSINWAYGIGVVIGVYASWGVSGAHLNPAVSLTMAVLGKLRWVYLPCYVMAQMIGAFLSAVCVYIVYYDALGNFDGGTRAVVGVNGTGGIFSTYPQDYLSIGSGVLDQVVGTALLLCGVLALTDSKNNKVAAGMEPLLVGLLVFAIGTSFGFNCGYAINPARDLGPRLFTAMAGWGLEVFRAGNHWWWVPIVGPLIGGLVGGLVYTLMVALHHPEDEDDKPVHESPELQDVKVPGGGVANAAMEDLPSNTAV
ncbi:PREDICTED: aquaporin-10-like [Branchiostoma belcheri]|uniref:Aquaporin-3 n=1 Tax=Branchiostoma belcheri TaxID=7741 RepID=A0A6P4Y9I5_BRABE|nr:PREDICTED: aquaporin-10-like [Branchiostoma belcheri]